MCSVQPDSAAINVIGSKRTPLAVRLSAGGDIEWRMASVSARKKPWNLPRSAVWTIRRIVGKSIVGSSGAPGSRHAVMCMPPHSGKKKRTAWFLSLMSLVGSVVGSVPDQAAVDHDGLPGHHP